MSLSLCIDLLIPPLEPLCDFPLQAGRGLFVASVHGDIQCGFAVLALQGQVGAAEQQDADGIYIIVLGCGMERGEAPVRARSGRRPIPAAF